MNTKPKQGVKRAFHRNGIVAVEESHRRQKLHGRCRTWHRNGKLAGEVFYRNGLLHGVCRQWNERGKLLGSFRMTHGTGIQKVWHDNGRLQLEFATVGGEFCGRKRLWLRDGTPLSDSLYLYGLAVTPGEYRKATAKNRRLPKLHGRFIKRPLPNRAKQKHIHRVFISSLLAKRNRSEAQAWLQSDNKTTRSLGHFKRVSDAAKFVGEIYQAGAIKIIVPDIYYNKRGDQFADALLVQLPKAAKVRKSIRKVCEKLRSQKLGAVEPGKDISETHLFLSMS
jgi:hypothetical protein